MAPQDDGPRTMKATFNLPPDLLEKLRAAAYWERVPIDGLVKTAIIEALKKMERKRGEPFPPRPPRR
jgi:hypothetical protein